MKNLYKKYLISVAFIPFFVTTLFGGAGVLPYTFHPETGELIFLVGATQDKLTSQFTPQKLFFGDFGGEKEGYEPWKKNAAREFNEKTLFFFATYFDSRKKSSKNKKRFYKKIYNKDNVISEKHKGKADDIITKKLQNSFYIQTKNYQLYLLYISYTEFYENIHTRNRGLHLSFGKSWINEKNNAKCTYFEWITAQSIFINPNQTATLVCDQEKISLKGHFYKIMTDPMAQFIINEIELTGLFSNPYAS